MLLLKCTFQQLSMNMLIMYAPDTLRGVLCMRRLLFCSDMTGTATFGGPPMLLPKCPYTQPFATEAVIHVHDSLRGYSCIVQAVLSAADRPGYSSGRRAFHAPAKVPIHAAFCKNAREAAGDHSAVLGHRPPSSSAQGEALPGASAMLRHISFESDLC